MNFHKIWIWAHKSFAKCVPVKGVPVTDIWIALIFLNISLAISYSIHQFTDGKLELMITTIKIKCLTLLPADGLAPLGTVMIKVGFCVRMGPALWLLILILQPYIRHSNNKCVNPTCGSECYDETELWCKSFKSLLMSNESPMHTWEASYLKLCQMQRPSLRLKAT